MSLLIHILDTLLNEDCELVSSNYLRQNFLKEYTATGCSLVTLIEDYMDSNPEIPLQVHMVMPDELDTLEEYKCLTTPKDLKRMSTVYLVGLANPADKPTDVWNTIKNQLDSGQTVERGETA